VADAEETAQQRMPADQGADFRGPGWTVLRGAFESLARFREARVFHPRGVVLSGELRTCPGSPLGDLPHGPVQVVARLSKGGGLPGSVPDVLGLAVRVTAPTKPWDLTLASAGRAGLGPMLLRPSWNWTTASYSSLAPYRGRSGLVWLLARCTERRPTSSSLEAVHRLVEQQPLEIEVSAAGLGEAPRLAGHIQLQRAQADRPWPAFDPMTNPPPGLSLYPGWLSRVREVAYVGSRAGRDPRAARSGQGRLDAVD
jgi:hypothetical protein